MNHPLSCLFWVFVYPNPPFFAGIVGMSDACVGRLSSVALVINFRKKSSVLFMVLRRGVVHFMGPQVEAFLLLVGHMC